MQIIKMEIKFVHLIPVVIFLQLFASTWVYADDAGLNSTDTLNESTSQGAPTNDGFSIPGAIDLGGAGGTEGDPFNFANFEKFEGMGQGGQGGVNPVNPLPADQPQQDQESGNPTRPPIDPNRVSTFPPLVHEGGNSTEKPKSETTTKAPGKGNYVYGSLAVVLSACVLHLFN